MDIGRENSPSLPTYRRALVPELLRQCVTFKEYLRTFFRDRFSHLQLIDLATGNGQFPLELAQQQELLGLEQITASDKDMSFMEKAGNRTLLEKEGVILKCIDIVKEVKSANLVRIIWGDPVEELPESDLYDIACLNAPYIAGKRGFFDEALAYTLYITKPKGLVFISLNEVGGETIMKEVVPKKYPIQRIDDFNGYPSTNFTERHPLTKRKCSIYVIIKDQQ